ncbi:unnamed protein product [Heligmosomoides polygyrus]|uniref:Uncharacterized protein n=1 Tax=Heligmosomoides polygyrus TaxID=6339 RepID=A0A183FTG0_HELPZ|nr:unnamed protein product [Heligmosomoides polygyrus]
MAGKWRQATEEPLSGKATEGEDEGGSFVFASADDDGGGVRRGAWRKRMKLIPAPKWEPLALMDEIGAA